MSGITAIEYRAMIRDMLDHENELINHRYDWLLTAQSILFGATALTDKSHFFLGLVICFIGMVSSLVTWRVLELADKSVKNLILLWKKYSEQYDLAGVFPPIYGLDIQYNYKLLPWKVMPPSLTVAWAAIALFYVNPYF